MISNKLTFHLSNIWISANWHQISSSIALYLTQDFVNILHWSWSYKKRKWLSTTIKYEHKNQYKTQFFIHVLVLIKCIFHHVITIILSLEFFIYFLMIQACNITKLFCSIPGNLILLWTLCISNRTISTHHFRVGSCDWIKFIFGNEKKFGSWC